MRIDDKYVVWLSIGFLVALMTAFAFIMISDDLRTEVTSVKKVALDEAYKVKTLRDELERLEKEEQEILQRYERLKNAR